MMTKEDELQRLFEFCCAFTRMDTILTDPRQAVKWRSITCHTPAPLQPYFEALRESLPVSTVESQPKILLHATPFYLHYISAPLCHAGRSYGSICTGPFLLEEPSTVLLNEVAYANQLPVGLLPLLSTYYHSLPLISQKKAALIADFFAYLTTNFDEGHAAASRPTTVYHLQNQHAILPETIKQKATEDIVARLEQRYHAENQLMAVIAAGNTEKLQPILHRLQAISGEIPDRIPNNPLRSRKNLLFVVNTLLRKAVETGGVHPIYIDSLSEKFAIQIEKSTSVQQLLDLQKLMYQEYCESVRKLSLSNWSPLIRRTIEYIRLYIHEELRLETIARAVHASPAELSRQFKQETKQSLTAFINKQRIQEAVLLLQNESMSITDIAQMVGFNDVNYFTKVFKQMKGRTPSQYRKAQQA